MLGVAAVEELIHNSYCVFVARGGPVNTAPSLSKVLFTMADSDDFDCGRPCQYHEPWDMKGMYTAFLRQYEGINYEYL